MYTKTLVTISAVIFCSMANAQSPAEEEPKPEMGFFVTSVNMGDGANLGGLEGADAHCQSLAEAANAGHRTWRAYLSTQATADTEAVNARDRIGVGPWHNANGHQIASNLDSLHYDNSAITREYALSEKGGHIHSRAYGDERAEHDILTGSNMDGTAIDSDKDMTCSNWTSNDEGSAMLGHHDRSRYKVLGSSWNSVHPSRGCSPEALNATAGAGLFYCFAAD